jgi:hypothetical protein
MFKDDDHAYFIKGALRMLVSEAKGYFWSLETNTLHV